MRSSRPVRGEADRSGVGWQGLRPMAVLDWRWLCRTCCIRLNPIAEVSLCQPSSPGALNADQPVAAELLNVGAGAVEDGQADKSAKGASCRSALLQTEKGFYNLTGDVGLAG